MNIKLKYVEPEGVVEVIKVPEFIRVMNIGKITVDNLCHLTYNHGPFQRAIDIIMIRILIALNIHSLSSDYRECVIKFFEELAHLRDSPSSVANKNIADFTLHDMGFGRVATW